MRVDAHFGENGLSRLSDGMVRVAVDGGRSAAVEVKPDRWVRFGVSGGGLF